MFIDFYRFTTI